MGWEPPGRLQGAPELRAVLFLDWHGDGRGYGQHDYTGSPVI
ncbi:hypothetical protein ACWGFX_27780 [Streptomyces xanthophaeus]